MSRFPIKASFTALLASFVLSGCDLQKGTVSPEDYIFLARSSLDGVWLGAMIGRNEAIRSKNFPACVTGEVLGEVSVGVSETLSKRPSGDVVIPPVDIDLSDCMAFSPGPRPQDREVIATYMEAFSGVALSAVEHYGLRLKQADCRKGTAVLGAVAYLQGLVKPIADEISIPDGMFSAPGVRISISECQEEASDQ